MVAGGERRAFCVFEYIYFARPDSKMAGTVLQVARARMGEILWREAPVEADLVIPVPDSGNAAARGLARAAGLPQDDGFIKNRYVARTFIQPGQELRRHGLRLKFNPLPEVVAGKRLIVVDDSIVRGNTMPQIVQMLRDAGAAEIHLRISSPPIKHPCHYGIDMSTREEMIAHGRTVEEVAERARRRLAALPLARGRLRGGRRRARRPTATRASAASIRSRAPRTANGKYALERSSCRCRQAPGQALEASRSWPPAPARICRRCWISVHGRDGIADRGGRVRQAGGAGARAGAARRRCRRRSFARGGSTPDRAARDRAMADWLAERGVELVVLAGYMQLLSARRSWRASRTPVINVHPALLPAFPGLAPSSRRSRTASRCSG